MNTSSALVKLLRALLLICLTLGLQVQQGLAGDSGASSSFRFVQITDTHLGPPGSLDRLARVVQRINELPFPIACVIHSGDVFEDSIADPRIRAQGQRILERLEPPLYVAPGNHDILRGDLERDRSVWSDAFSGLFHTKRVRGVRFVFAYTIPLTGSFHVPGYEPLARLRTALDPDRDRPVIVVHHAPSLPELVNGVHRGGWSEERRLEWIRLLRRGGAIAVLAGHFHRGELHWLGEVPLYVAPPVANTQGASAFRVYTYRDGNLSYRTFRVPFPEHEPE